MTEPTTHGSSGFDAMSWAEVLAARAGGEFVRGRRGAWLALLGLACVLFCGMGARADEGPKVAILVVSRKGDDPQGKMVAKRIVQLRSEAGYSVDQIGVLGVHFDSHDDRKYCEDHLNIHSGNLLFVGVVTLGLDGLPEKVLFRIDNARDPAKAAQESFKKAQSTLSSK